MSVESLAIALHHSQAKGAARLVLIGIANHDGDGGAWPAVSTLAKYAGGIDRRGVQRAIETLEGLGEIKRLRGQGGDHSTADHLRPNLYRFLLVCPEGCDRTRNHRMPRQSAPLQLSETVPEQVGGGADTAGGESAAGGADTAWWGGADTARTIHSTDINLKETNPSNRAQGNEDALARGDIQAASAGVARCGHEAIPGRGTCIFACREDFKLRQAVGA